MKGAKNLRLSAVELAQHQIVYSTRKSKTSIGFSDVIKRFYAEKEKISTRQQQILFGLILSSIWIATTDIESTKIKIHYFDIEFRKVYALFLSSCLMCMFYLTSFASMFLDRTIWNIIKIAHKADPLSLGLQYDASNAWSAPLILNPRFFERPKILTRLSSISGYVFMFPIIILVGAIYFSLLNQVFVFALSKNFLIFDIVAVFSSFLFLFFCLIHVFTCLYRFKTRRNSEYIRWVFLSTISLRQGLLPPRSSFWLNSATKQEEKPAVKKS
ncbi:MAG: hypothetical protein INF16_12555 [Methylobacterium sp.]|nr:hypothetical protein [Methylobacterium sp.]